MSSQPSNLFSLARSKLNLSVDSRDSFSLHRWVLLKNSMFQSLPAPSSSAPPDEEEPDDEADSFMFPDAGQLVESPCADAEASEAAWFDALMETLVDDDDDDFAADSDVHVSVEPVDDDEDLSHSPPISPMSSSDDLTLQYYPHLVPYPPFPRPLISSYHLIPPLAASNSPYVDPLPYFDLEEDLDIPPVPDAIEDTSDDESDTPPTPGQSLSSLSLDPASIPLPTENSRLRYANPHVYIDSEDDNEYFYPFDPLPFPDDPRTPIQYTECC